MHVDAIAGWLLIAGAALFIGGAFLPVSRIYMTAAPEEKLAIVQGSPVMWQAHLAGMAAGAAVTVVGLGGVASVAGPPASAAALAWAGAGAALAGALLWERHIYLRVIDLEGFVFGTSPFWHFLAFSALMHVALLAFGVAFLLADYPTWLAIVTIGGVTLTATAFAIFRDVPPLVYYMLTLVAGVALVAL